MHRRRFSIALPSVVLLCWTLAAHAQQPAANSLTASEKAEGWTLLFDGTTLTGWAPTGTADFKVEDGTITVTSGVGMLGTTKSFGNFDFKTDFWIDNKANSGVFFRCAEGDPGNRGCYEANMFDSHDRWPTGSLNNVKTSLPDKPETIGKWNTFEIVAEGNHLVVKVNGKTTADAEDAAHPSGTIALQEGGANGIGTVRFRNIKIRPR